MLIGIHEPPGLVEEPSDNLDWASIEIFEGSLLCILE